MPIDASQKSRRPRRRPANERLDQLFLKSCRQPAPTSHRNHLIQIDFPPSLGPPLKNFRLSVSGSSQVVSSASHPPIGPSLPATKFLRRESDSTHDFAFFQ